MKCIFLDEFGHDGAYVSRLDTRFNQSPVFGFGGFIIPHENVREFSQNFIALKSYHLNIPFERAAHNHERKGTAIFHGDAFASRTKKSVARNVLKTGHRLLKLVENLDGKIYYTGLEKALVPAEHRSENLHTALIRRSVESINQSLDEIGDHGLIVFDEHSLHNKRTKMLIRYIFSRKDRVNIVEPPFQAESILYNTIQAADWICALLGRVFNFKVQPNEWGAQRPYYDKFFPQIDAATLAASEFRVVEPELPLG